MPSTNVRYWTRKIARNVERDRKAIAALGAAGWRCRVIWACSLSQGVTRLLNELARKDVRERKLGHRTGSRLARPRV